MTALQIILGVLIVCGLRCALRERRWAALGWLRENGVSIELAKSAVVSGKTIAVLKCPGRLSCHAADALKKSWERSFPEMRCVVLEDGMDVQFISEAA